MGIGLLSWVASVPSLAMTGYLGALGIAGGRVSTPTADAANVGVPPLQLAFVVPAHNEAAGIERTVSSLLAVHYPRDFFTVLVVADNCTDDTAQFARRAGARVLERHDTERRGKGYALEHAFGVLLSEGAASGFVVVDADSEVSPNLLESIALRLRSGEMAVQAHYGVRNVDDSWRTRLMDYAFTLIHGVRSTARERFRLSSGLRGNGMGFSVDALRRVPYRAYTLAEDVEYGIELGLHGIRVAYAGESEVRGDMVSSGATSRPQRERWEHGRRLLIKRYAVELLRRGLRERSPMLIDLALDTLVPPLATVALVTGTGLSLSVGAAAAKLTSFWAIAPWAASTVLIGAYLARGVQLSPRGVAVLLDAAHVPEYVAWKLWGKLRKGVGRSDEWVRTPRSDDVLSASDHALHTTESPSASRAAAAMRPPTAVQS